MHFERYVLKMQVGTVTMPSKTEHMFILPHRNDVIDAADLAPVKADDEGGVVTSTDFFKYLGGGVDSALTDSRDVDRIRRTKSAAGAFGALRKAIFSSRHIKLRTKKAVYLAIVVNILLYGAECWCLTEELLDRLRVFHNQCVRAMCGVKLWHQWRHGIRNRELRKRLKMESLDQLVAARKLRWAGHVARMGHERLPRRFLTSWIRNPRPHGRPQFTYGHSLNKTLEWAGISTDFAVWSELAQDRPAWRALILATATCNCLQIDRGC